MEQLSHLYRAISVLNIKYTRQMTTTTRLLRLLSLLQTPRDWPGSLLASRLSTSGRTIRRDIDRLREMGYSIQSTMGPDGGYRLEAGNELPPLLFDDDQTIAIALALQVAPAIGAGIEEAALRASNTIRQVMPSRLRHRLGALEVTTVGKAGDAELPNVSPSVIVMLATAIRRQEILRFEYVTPTFAENPQPPAPPLRVEPLHLAASHGRWYLLGWELDREDWRLYRVDRIRLRTPNGPRFEKRTLPGGNVNDFISAFFKGSKVNKWPCTGTVILDLPANKVLPFAGDGTVTIISEDKCSLEVGSWSWGALAASFGRFEVAMEVVDPPELISAFEALAKRYTRTSAKHLA